LVQDKAGSQSIDNPNLFVISGTIRFNLLSVEALVIEDDNGSILSPVNPPDNVVEGQRVKISYVEAVTPPGFHPLPHPIRILTIAPLIEPQTH